MDDQQVWDLGGARLNTLLTDISPKARLELMPLLTRYRDIKETFSSLIAQVDAAAVCRECRGQCCLNGKYRINVLDALARNVSGVRTPADFSLKPVCPYGSETGCTMEPGLRPSDCVVFICDELDSLLTPQVKATLVLLEKELRKCIDDASRLTGENVGTPLLLWAESKALK